METQAIAGAGCEGVGAGLKLPRDAAAKRLNTAEPRPKLERDAKALR